MNGGDVIVACRRRAGLTQADVARRVGTTSSVVSRWERGHVEPAFSTVMAIVTACGQTLDELIDDAVSSDDRALLASIEGLSIDQRLQRLIDHVDFIRSARTSLAETRVAEPA